MDVDVNSDPANIIQGYIQIFFFFGGGGGQL